MQSDNKAKVFAMKTIMNNPRLSKILDEGLRAPAGSTKRQRAKSVISIIRKMGTTPDGSATLKNQIEKMNSAKNPYAELYRRTFSQDGQGGPADTTGTTSPSFLKRAPTPTFAGSTGTTKPMTGLIPSLLGVIRELPEVVKSGEYQFGKGVLGAGALLGGLGEYGLANLASSEGTPGKTLSKTAGFQAFNKLYPGLTKPVSGTTPATTQTTSTTNKPAVTSSYQPKTPQQLGIGFESDVPGASYTPTKGQAGYTEPTVPIDSGAQEQTTGTSTIGNNPWAGGDYERLWETLPASVRTALLTAITPGQFAITTMADKEKLRALFPGVPDNMLPTGAGLQGQIDALQDRLKEEYHIDQLANEYNNAVNSGSTLVPDMTDYIKGRDTYIKKVDGMIDSTKRNMYSGSSLPSVQAANKSYVDFLTVLKGRQNNRYIDLLNNSITRNTATIENIKNEYNTNFQNYKDQLTSDAAITTDTFNKMYTELSNMATMVLQGPTAVREVALQQAQIDQTYSSALKDAASAKTTGMDFIKDAKDFDSYFSEQDANKKTVLQSGINLKDKIQSAIMSGKDISSIASYLKNALVGSYGGGLDDLTKGKTMVQQFKDNGGDEMMAQNGYPAVFSDDMLATLNQAASRAASSAITNSTAPSIKSALDWLTNLDPKTLASKETDFINRFKTGTGANIDPRLLSAIWKYYVATASSSANSSYFKDKASRKKIFQLLQQNVPEQDALNALSTQIAKSL